MACVLAQPVHPLRCGESCLRVGKALVERLCHPSSCLGFSTTMMSAGQGQAPCFEQWGLVTMSGFFVVYTRRR